MKKLLLIASALLAFSFFGCTQPSNPDTGNSDVSTPAPEPIVFTENIEIVKNYDYNSKKFTNFQVNIECLKNVQLKEGDIVTVDFTADLSREVGVIQGNFVDTTEAASWWTILTTGEGNKDQKILDAGEGNNSNKIESSTTYNITKNATDKGAAKFVIYANGSEDEDPIKLSNVQIKITVK